MTEPALRVTGLVKACGATTVLDGVDLTLAPGAVVALLGPSGCGKTTLLRLVAGFDRADAGTIDMAGRRVASPDAWVPPHRRGIGYVPQEGALFPHLSVAGNIGFGLSPAHRRSGRIEALLDLIGMNGFGSRMPHELSGGQQQRVALARALAPAPAIVLLDEPFNALDAHLRRTLCADVRGILRDSGAAALLVTHDRDEAFSIADEIAVMRSGRLVQIGAPSDLYRDPVDMTTARLVGPAFDLVGQLVGDIVETALGSLPVRNLGRLPDGLVKVMVRPEQVVPALHGAGQVVTVRHAALFGPMAWLELTCPGETRTLSACWPAMPFPVIGARLDIRVAGDVLVYPADI